MRPFGYQLVYILFTYLSGLFLCLAPWSFLWRTNYFTTFLDPVSTMVTGWIRGAISALGLVNLAFALFAIYRIPETVGKGRGPKTDAPGELPHV